MKAKFALATVSVILLVSFAANVNFYLHQHDSVLYNALLTRIPDLQNQIADSRSQAGRLLNDTATLESQAAHLENQVRNLQNQTSSLQNENSELKSKNAKLQNQLTLLNQVKTPAKLVTRLGANDMRYNYSGQDIRLYITGEVWNVGTETAQNCGLHVTLYQGDTVATDIYIPLGDIAGGFFTDVARNIYYTGDALTNWTAVPEFG